MCFLLIEQSKLFDQYHFFKEYPLIMISENKWHQSSVNGLSHNRNYTIVGPLKNFIRALPFASSLLMQKLNIAVDFTSDLLLF